jgi:hypothetical protein
LELVFPDVHYIHVGIETGTGDQLFFQEAGYKFIRPIAVIDRGDYKIFFHCLKYFWGGKFGKQKTLAEKKASAEQILSDGPIQGLDINFYRLGIPGWIQNVLPFPDTDMLQSKKQKLPQTKAQG